MAEMYRVRQVTPATRIYGLVGGASGEPVAAPHNQAFAARGVDACTSPSRPRP